jgi:DNA-binding TFAR19-related protein (PDSD5 family)
MADFTESMKAFTDRLKSSIDERGESLANIHQATTDLLGGARDFLENVALEHSTRAEQVHAFMSSSRANREETVKAMRDSHCESLAAMSDEMHRALDEATKSRVEEVKSFMSASHAYRCETSKAMRDSHREELAAMSDELHHTLDEANKSRLETVGMMRSTFKAAQNELATDLRDAAKAWREFAASR